MNLGAGLAPLAFPQHSGCAGSQLSWYCPDSLTAEKVGSLHGHGSGEVPGEKASWEMLG